VAQLVGAGDGGGGVGPVAEFVVYWVECEGEVEELVNNPSESGII
jgi:hypothetical protein